MNAASAMMPFGMVFGGVLDRRFGVRIATTIGCAFFCAGWALTYFTVKKSLVFVSLSYGALSQFGLTTAYGPPAQNASKWFPKRPVLAVGSIVCGVGGGAMIFNQVVTAYLNPQNLTPDLKTSDGQRYFTDKDVLDRVPNLFLILPAIYVVSQAVGILALSTPPHEETKIKRLIQGSQDMDKSPRVHVPVKQVLWKMCKSKNGIIILAFTFFLDVGMVFAVSLYKAYGQTFISDDHFMALVGSISSIFNSLCRPFWGLVIDKFGFQIAVKVPSACFTCLLCTLLFTEYLGKAAFIIWICGIYGTFCCLFPVCPTTLGKLFGEENMVVLMGPFFLALSLASIGGGFVGLNLENVIGWHGLFLFGGFMGAIAFFITFFFDGKDRDGKPL